MDFLIDDEVLVFVDVNQKKELNTSDDCCIWEDDLPAEGEHTQVQDEDDMMIFADDHSAERVEPDESIASAGIKHPRALLLSNNTCRSL